MEEYYNLPTVFGKITRKNRIAKCNLRESVNQHINLILVTRFGEFRYDREFGCSIWDYDFEILPRINAWKNDMAHSIAGLLDQLEPRLKDVTVKVSISLEEFRTPAFQNVRQVKRKITVSVKGYLAPTNEPFENSDYEIYFSPISLD